MTPRVTVLMSIYNSPIDMLAQAIDSILVQSFSDFELLILDDGSEDPQLRDFLIERMIDDSRIRIAWEPHRGLTPTLNRGLALARGQYIARHDADDWSAPQRLQLQVATLDADPDLDLCGSSVWTHQDNGNRLWQVALPQSHASILTTFAKGNPFMHGATMFRRAAAQDIGGYREAFPCAQDYDFFWRMAERGGAVNLPQPLYHYRYTLGSISVRKALVQMQAHQVIKRLAAARHRGDLEDPQRELTEVSNGAVSDAIVYRSLLKQADHLMLAGHYRNAFKAYWELVNTHPLSPLAWAKLGRLGLFRTMPFLREVSFR